MMKIQMQEVDGQLILQVEGRLAGAFVRQVPLEPKFIQFLLEMGGD